MPDIEVVRLQPQTAELVGKILKKRLDNDGVRDSKTRIVAQAVKNLADKELDE